MLKAGCHIWLFMSKINGRRNTCSMVFQSNHFYEPSIETIIFDWLFEHKVVEVQFTKINSLGKNWIRVFGKKIMTLFLTYFL